MILVGKTWKGRVRSRNEDVYWTRPELQLCGVADGMGGLDAGHIAARMTADEVTQRIRDLGPDNMDCESLETIVKEANREIHARARALPDVRAMGATLVMLKLVANLGFICHAGDSRAYLLRNDEFMQMTRDHNLINEKIDKGELNEEEANSPRVDNRVMQCIGPSQVVKPTITEFEVQPKDLFMLCSDGLSGFVSNDALSSIMYEHRSNINLLLDKLIDAAGDHGSTDNITVVLAEVN
ncbi:MAG: protein phosphatase 2C domain-containing protein [Gammaproteobacteria bacterium]|nr:protein phosphatase 2C domain-containing protein [Gammaproteobacteria bacterium]